jgi:hypothetical protein
MKNLFAITILSLFIFSCENTSKEDLELKELFSLMQGSFNSENQAKQDSTYYNISLHMYPIWEEKGNYLYVEQALNSMQNRPYRQRIYKVTRLNDSVLSSSIYTIPADSLWIGKWKTPKAFDSITPNNIIERIGCEVLLRRIGDKKFKGETGVKTCKSSLRGASYATSEVEMNSSKIISWDRGFDKDGKQVWGAEKSGYVFDKLSNKERE